MPFTAARTPGRANSGLAEEIQQALLLGEDFCRAIRDMKDKVIELWQNEEFTVGVSINCRWGKHRSVAAAEARASWHCCMLRV